MRILFNFQERGTFSSVAVFETEKSEIECISIFELRDLLHASIYNIELRELRFLVENQSLIAADFIHASVDCVEHGRINQAKQGTFYVAGGCTENSRAHASIKAIW